MYWIIAKNTAGEAIGTEPLADAIPPPDDSHSHHLALTVEFRRLLQHCWPGSQWVMIDPHRYAVFRADTGVVGTLSLASAENLTS